MTATGERLENLPPQQTPTDANFDTDSYVKNLKRQIKQDAINTRRTEKSEDVLKKAESVQVEPMKFDGKQLRGATVNVVTAPKQGNKNIGPIAVAIVLFIALVAIAIYIFMFSGLIGGKTEIKFIKPVGWEDTVYAYVYNTGDDLSTKTPVVDFAKEEYKMVKESDGTYSYKVGSNYKDGYVIFFDGKNIYPSKDNGSKIENEKTYTAPDVEGSSSETSSASSSASSAA